MTALNGMGEISTYYGFSAPTILALIRHRGFPARKLSGGTWASDKELIDAWRKDQILNGDLGAVDGREPVGASVVGDGSAG